MSNLSKSAIPFISLVIIITLPIISCLFPGPIATGIGEAILFIIGVIYDRIKNGNQLESETNSRIMTQLLNILNNFLKHLGLFAAILLVNGLVAFFSASADDAMLEMQKKGIIVFPPDLLGFEHMHIYISGFIGSALLTLVLGWYGIILGRDEKELSYTSLFFSILCAVFFAKLLINISGNSGYDILKKTKPPFPIPSGTLPLETVFRVSMYIAQSAFFAAIVWVLALFSRWISNIFRSN